MTSDFPSLYIRGFSVDPPLPPADKPAPQPAAGHLQCVPKGPRPLSIQESRAGHSSQPEPLRGSCQPQAAPDQRDEWSILRGPQGDPPRLSSYPGLREGQPHARAQASQCYPSLAISVPPANSQVQLLILMGLPYRQGPP